MCRSRFGSCIDGYCCEVSSIDDVWRVRGQEGREKIPDLCTGIFNLVLPMRQLYLKEGDCVFICTQRWMLMRR